MVGPTFLVKTDFKSHELRNDCGRFFALFACSTDTDEKMSLPKNTVNGF